MSASDLSWLEDLTPMERLAGANREALEELFSQIRHAVHDASLDHDRLGSSLGVTADEARRLLCGRPTLTLADLQALLVAVDARLYTRLETDWTTKRESPRPSERAQPDTDDVWKRSRPQRARLSRSPGDSRTVQLKDSDWVDA